jgi:TctA family transporter
MIGNMWEGIMDAFRNIRLVIQGCLIGIWVGFTPGLGAHAADWLAYGFAAQTCKGARQTFGKGDVRGVIAPDSTNSSTDCGALIPTTLLGVPGSLTKAFFMLALIMMGITPGPDMLTKHLDLLFVMIWVMFWATLIGGIGCLLFANPLAKITALPYTMLVPMIIGFSFLGAFGSNRHGYDLALFVLSGLLGVMMLRRGYPRAPLIMGLILGTILEKYLYISVQRYGLEWLGRPQIMILLPIVLGLFIYTILVGRRKVERFEGENISKLASNLLKSEPGKEEDGRS